MSFNEPLHSSRDPEVEVLRRQVAGLQSEIAERKQTEEILDRFFTASLDMLCLADFRGYFKRLNPAWERTLGFTAEELCRHPFLDFVHPDDRETTLAEMKKLSEGLNTIFLREPVSLQGRIVPVAELESRAGRVPRFHLRDRARRDGAEARGS